MLVSMVQDCKRKERTITVLAGFKKANGNIHAQIKNDKGERYHVTLRPNGSFECRHEVNGKHEACPASAKTHYVRRCYHVQAVERIACLFTDEGYLPKHLAPRDMQYLYFNDEPAAAAITGDKSYEEALSAAYEQLGATKKVSAPIAQGLSKRGLMRGQRQQYCGGQRIA
jgi:hypothetical protein